ncbi:ead/Ea22-like family protein [Pseudomonas aeruginosa]|nr:ead/Ea22-like family protein [Pseudomonas aeruginosa]
MTDYAELRRLAKAATPGPWRCNRHWAIVGGPTLEFTNGAAQQQIAMACWQSWMHEEELRNNAEFIAAANPKNVLALLGEIDRLKAENDALRGALQAVEAEVDGNIRQLTRDLVNMVSGLKNGSHPNDIYEHCDEIERIIGAALEGDKP